MKKLFPLVLAIVLILCLVACGNNQSETPEDTTTSHTTDTTAASSTMPTAPVVSETQTEFYPTGLTTPEGYLPYPVTTAISARDQEVTDWVRRYLAQNKNTIDMIVEEILALDDYLWGVSNPGDGNGFIRNPNIPDKDWGQLSKQTQRRIEAIDADFRKMLLQHSDLILLSH